MESRYTGGGGKYIGLVYRVVGLIQSSILNVMGSTSSRVGPLNRKNPPKQRCGLHRRYVQYVAPFALLTGYLGVPDRNSEAYPYYLDCFLDHFYFFYSLRRRLLL